MKSYSYLKLHGCLLLIQLFVLAWGLMFPMSFNIQEVVNTQLIFTGVHILGNIMFNYLEDNGKIIEWKIWKADEY